MINKLKGIVSEKTEKSISITVAEVFTFEIFIINSDYFNLHEEYILYISMIFSPDKGYAFYGFLDTIQKTYFLILQDCRGVGAKIALQILDQLSIEQIYQAIATENKLIFESISGIGKKKAELIILELKSKITKLSILPKKDFYLLHDDFIASLRALGYNQKEINSMVQEVYKLKIEKDISLGQLIEKALTIEK